MKSKPRNLKMQFKDKLNSITRFGESKREKQLKEKKQHVGGVYSNSTYKNYKDVYYNFCDYLKEKNYYSNIKNLKDAKPYVKEYIDSHREKKYSSWTINKEISAFKKIYEDSIILEGEKRLRGNIKRSRNVVKNDKFFNEKRHKEIVCLLKNSGLRRTEINRIENLKLKDIVNENGQYYINLKSGKGGKGRVIPVLKNGNEALEHFISLANDRGDERLFDKKANTHADIHGYRIDYTRNFYNSLCKDTKLLKEMMIKLDINRANIPSEKNVKSQVYRSKEGNVYDRDILATISASMGHNRLNVTVVYLEATTDS